MLWRTQILSEFYAGFAFLDFDLVDNIISQNLGPEGVPKSLFTFGYNSIRFIKFLKSDTQFCFAYNSAL